MLGKAIQNFSDKLLALGDFVTVIGSVLDQNATEFLKHRSRDMIPMTFAMHSMNPDSGKQLTQEAARLKEEFGAEIVVEPLDTGEGCQIKLSGEASERFLAAMKGWLTGRQHRSLLYRSALISLVSAGEWFLSQVIREYFTRYPDAAEIKDKTLTFKDLASIGNVEEARQGLIDLRIDEIMWGGLEDWLKFLAGPLKLSMGYLNAHSESLSEFFRDATL
jgi:hypothetical protein